MRIFHKSNLGTSNYERDRSEMSNYSGKRGGSQQREEKMTSRLQRTVTDYSVGRSSRQQARRPDALSQRTTSSGKRGAFVAKNSVTSGRTNVAFQEDARSNFGNLDLKPAEDIDEILMQRNKRFEALRKYQNVLQQTQDKETPGQQFLERIQEKTEAEKAKRL